MQLSLIRFLNKYDILNFTLLFFLNLEVKGTFNSKVIIKYLELTHLSMDKLDRKERDYVIMCYDSSIYKMEIILMMHRY